MTYTNPMTEVEMTITFTTIPVEDDREGTALHPVCYRPWRQIERIECPTVDECGTYTGYRTMTRPTSIAAFGWDWVARVETDASEGLRF